MCTKSLSPLGAGRPHVLPTRAGLPSISFFALMLRLSPIQDMHGYVFRSVRYEVLLAQLYPISVAEGRRQLQESRETAMRPLRRATSQNVQIVNNSAAA